MNEWGEYHMPEERTPREIHDLRMENRAQNMRLERVEKSVTELRVALVGIDDRNGLRGELRDHKDYTTKALTEIEAKIDTLVPRLMKSIAAIVTVVGTVVGIAVGLVRIL